MLTISTPLAGQRLTPMPPYVAAALPVRSQVPRFDSVLTTRTVPRTYWLEGGIVGGVGIGVLSALWVRGMSESSSTAGTVAGFVLGAAVGFPAGALIGGQFKKPSP